MQADTELPADPDAGGDADAPADERVAETYDDAEFYQQLLKEFLEGSAAAGARVQTLSQVNTGNGQCSVSVRLLPLVPTMISFV